MIVLGFGQQFFQYLPYLVVLLRLADCDGLFQRGDNSVLDIQVTAKYRRYILADVQAVLLRLVRRRSVPFLR